MILSFFETRNFFFHVVIFFSGLFEWAECLHLSNGLALLSLSWTVFCQDYLAVSFLKFIKLYRDVFFSKLDFS